MTALISTRCADLTGSYLSTNLASPKINSLKDNFVSSFFVSYRKVTTIPYETKKLDTKLSFNEFIFSKKLNSLKDNFVSNFL
jgi:hypothetical protein